MDPDEDLTTALLAARPNGQPPAAGDGAGLRAPAARHRHGGAGRLHRHHVCPPRGRPGSAPAAARQPQPHPAALEEYLRLFTPYRACRARRRKTSSSTARPSAPTSPSPSPTPRPIATKPSSRRRPLSSSTAPTSRTIAFGRGIHQCAGIPLARLMLGIALEEFVLRTEHCELAGPVKMARWAEWGRRRCRCAWGV